MQKIPLITNWTQAWELIQTDFNIQISLSQQNQIQLFYKILSETNKVMNLTRLSSEPDFLTFHLIDTITLLSCFTKLNLQNESEFKYLDLGSGGGIPGIILHILLSKNNTLLCDSTQKKANYLRKVVDEIKLQNINISHERVEIINKKQNYKRKFNLITARAFAKPIECLSLIKPFLSVQDGYFLAQSTTNLSEDLIYQESLKNLNLKINDIFEFDLAEKKRFVLNISYENS